jgi:hypothetical protein
VEGATFALRLLAGAPTAPPAPDEWPVFITLARGNAVLVRVADRLATAAIGAPAALVAAAAEERQRVAGALALVESVAHNCAAAGIECLFPSALVHAPDVGGDLDVLVLDDDLEVDRHILAGLDAVRRPRDFGSRLAATTSYRVSGFAIRLDVHHGRLGVVGEHADVAAQLVRRRRHERVGDDVVGVPSTEDQMLIQGLHRAYGRLRLKLGDIVYAMGAARRQDMDWDAVAASARAAGVRAGLAWYLACVEAIHRAALDAPLFDGARRRLLGIREVPPPAFRGGAYRLPALGTNGPLYLEQLAAHLGAGRWAAAARVCLAPAVGAGRAVRWLTCRSEGGAAAEARTN